MLQIPAKQNAITCNSLSLFLSDTDPDYRPDVRIIMRRSTMDASSGSQLHFLGLRFHDYSRHHRHRGRLEFLENYCVNDSDDTCN